MLSPGLEVRGKGSSGETARKVRPKRADSLLAGLAKLVSRSVTPDPANRTVTTALGGVADALVLDGFGGRTSYSATYQGSAIFTVTYTPDALGRISQKVESVDGVTTTYEYSYDVLGRLGGVSTQVGSDAPSVVTYHYDANGNRKSVEVDGADVVASADTLYDDQDRLIRYGSTVYTYGAAGELKTKTDTSTGVVTTYDYDAMGNLRSVALPDGRAVSYVIDGNGRRVRKLVDGVAVQGFLYRDRLRVIAELDGQNNVVSRFVYADGEGSEEMAVANALTRLGIYTSRPTPGGPGKNVPAYMVRMSDNAVFRIIADHLGTPRLVVNVATGEVAQALAFDAWGVSTQDTAPGLQPFGFAGGIWDRDTGLVRFGARDYDPGVGRWTSKDPMSPKGKAVNAFTYAGDDPVNHSDPSGEDACTTCLASLAATVALCAFGCPVISGPLAEVCIAICIAGIVGETGACESACLGTSDPGAPPPDSDDSPQCGR